MGGLRLDSRKAMLDGGDNGPVLVPGDPAKSQIVAAVRHDGEHEDAAEGEAEGPRDRRPDRVGRDEGPVAGAPRRLAKDPTTSPADDALGVPAGGAAAAAGRARRRPRINAGRCVRAGEARSGRPDAVAPGGDGGTPAPRHLRPDRPAADAGGGRGVPGRRRRRTPTAASSTGCWRRRTTASAGAGTGSTSPATPTPRATSSRRSGATPTPTPTATTSSEAFNEDLPYDRFVVEQLAADQLPLGDDKRPLAAMGFLTLGRRFLNNVHDIIDDRIDVVTRGLLGLTVACARCHDHKYDPIPTKDYYSLYGVFASSRRAEGPAADRRAAADGRDGRVRGGTGQAQAEVNAFRRRSATQLATVSGRGTDVGTTQSRRRPWPVGRDRKLPPTSSTGCSTVPNATSSASWRRRSRRSRRTRRPPRRGRWCWTTRRSRSSRTSSSAATRATAARAVPRQFLEVLAGAGPQAVRRRQRPAGAGQGHRRPGQPADGAGDGQPRLDAPLRQGPGRHAERLRRPQRAADAPRAARLAGRRVRGATAGRSRSCTG